MEKKNSKTLDTINIQQANLIAQSLNLLFNNATFYGGTHPSTKKSGNDCANILSNLLSAKNSLITLVRNGQSLYIEKRCVNSRMNVNRLIPAFQKAGIESISFHDGIEGQDLQVFIDVFTKMHKKSTAEEINQTIESQNVGNVKINFVFFQKMTKNDAIINKDDINIEETSLKNGLEISKKNIHNSIVNKSDSASSMLKHIDKLFTMQEIINKPSDVAGAILQHSNNEDFSIVEKIRSLNTQVQKDVKSNHLSADEIMASVVNLTSKLKDGFSIQKEMGKILSSKEEVFDEVDLLTYNTIVQLVCKEYAQGKITIKRLGTIIRRMLPDIKDLKRVLPLLKDALLEEGMILSDYLALTHELSNELDNDDVIELLQSGAEEIGLSTHDLISAINKDPQETARILVLASEIKQGTGNKNKLSDFLTDYIESVSTAMATESNKTNSTHGTDALEDIIKKLETDLVTKISDDGMADSVVADIKTELTQRFPKTLKKIKTEWVVNKITSTNKLSHNSAIAILDSVVNKQANFDVSREAITSALSERGMSQDEINVIYQDVVKKVLQKDIVISLPKNIISSNNTKFFLQRHIREFLRYNNPFSCINISFIAFSTDEVLWNKSNGQYIAKVIVQTSSVLNNLLRGLDIVGSTGDLEKEPLFIILTMTDSSGSEIVRDRIQQRLESEHYTQNGFIGFIKVAVTNTVFSQEKSKDFKTFLKQVSDEHSKECTQQLNILLNPEKPPTNHHNS